MIRAAAVGRALRGAAERRGSKGYDWLQRHYEQKAAAEALKKELDAADILPPVKDGHQRARAFLEFSRDSGPVGRVEVELADDLVPVTAENFLRLCDGNTALDDEKFSYKGTEIHQIMKESWLLMGDVGHRRGRGGHSAFADRYFDDEGYFFRHAKPGILSMANGGAHLNGSCFFITLKPCLHLDGRHVPFGRVTSGMEVLKDLAGDLIVKGRPTSPIRISDCGSL